jgi:hypothetical protein
MADGAGNRPFWPGPGPVWASLETGGVETDTRGDADLTLDHWGRDCGDENSRSGESKRKRKEETETVQVRLQEKPGANQGSTWWQNVNLVGSED